MKTFLKFSIGIAITLLIPFHLHAQNPDMGFTCVSDFNQVSAPESMGNEESRFGYYLPASGTYRVLVIFVEVNYNGVNSDPYAGIPSTNWPAGSVPNYAGQMYDPNPGMGTGIFTRYFEDASLNNLTVLGDYLIDPNSPGGVLTVNETDILALGGGFSSLPVAAMNAANALGTLTTSLGFSITDFDAITPTGFYEAKTLAPNASFDHVQFIYRNAPAYTLGNNTGFNNSPASGSLFGYNVDSYDVINAFDEHPLNILRHEFMHSLIGGNIYHNTGGGCGQDDYYFPINSGYSLMSGTSLKSFCGWDRWHYQWKDPSRASVLMARDETNSMDVNGDLDAINYTQEGIYVLRDFASTGDVIRIKLPFLDHGEFPEWLWIENHLGAINGGNEFDVFRWQGAPCIDDAPHGIYMQLQIDRNAIVPPGIQPYDGFANYIRPIPANGAYDFQYDPQTNNNCINQVLTYPFEKLSQFNNPLTGTHDEECTRVDNGNGHMDCSEHRVTYVEKVSGNYETHMPLFGRASHAFTLAGNNKIGMGTNPCTATKMTLVGDDYVNTGVTSNVRSVFLNGVSVEILEQNTLTDGTIKLRIRFDDTDISHDVRWCADDIVLNPLYSQSGFSLNVINQSTLTLDRGLNPTRIDNPSTFNGQPVFTDPTVLTIKTFASANLASVSKLIVDNGSTLILEPYSLMQVGDLAELRVTKGSRLILKGNSVLRVMDNGLVKIEEGGWLEYEKDAQIILNGDNALVDIEGNLILAKNANFTFTKDASSQSGGYVRFSYPYPVSYTLYAGSGSSITFSGNGPNDKVLEITQEALYCDAPLKKITVSDGLIALGALSRLSASSALSLTNSTVTSVTGGFNSHGGLYIFGQQNVTIDGCIFEYGYEGIAAVLSVGGFSLTVSNSIFRYNTTGLHSIGKGVSLSSCNFYYNDKSWFGELMSYPSKASFSTFENSTTSCIDFTSTGTSSLSLNKCVVDQNRHIGVYYSGRPSLNITCGQVTNNGIPNNYPGIFIDQGADLNMSPNSQPATGYVVATNNFNTIRGSCAGFLNLDQGLNNLVPYQHTMAIAGSFNYACSVTSVNEYYNMWNPLNSSPVQNIDYSTSHCSNCGSTAFTLADPSPSSAPCALRPANSNAPVSNPEDCSRLNSGAYQNKTVNAVFNDAMDQFALQNHTAAAVILYQILQNPPAVPTEKDNWYIALSYSYYKSAVANAYQDGSLVNKPGSKLNPFLENLLGIQNKLIADAINKDNYARKLFTSLDVAATYILASDRKSALVKYEEILRWCLPSDIDYVTRLHCITSLEEQVITGEINKRDFLINLRNCPDTRIESEMEDNLPLLITSPEISIIPNPASSVFTIRTSIPDSYHNCQIKITNLMGQLISSFEVNNNTTETKVDGSNFDSGIYAVTVLSENKIVKIEKLIIAK